MSEPSREIGAAWWRESFRAPLDAVARRDLLKSLLAGGLTVAVGAAVTEAVVARDALEMQRTYGWNFGVPEESVAFDGEAELPWDRASLGRLADNLAPSRAALLPYHQRTLFDAPSTAPAAKDPLAGDAPRRLEDVLRPMVTPAMGLAYRRGKALSHALATAGARCLVLVNLPGPESIALAAGMADAFDCVATFDNWPHPRGVVRSHETLAAALYYQPLFARAAATRAASAPAALVLDRDRLAPYKDASDRFDNRYVAKLPTPAGLQELGVDRALYVSPGAHAIESDDLNDDLVAYAAAGVDVRLLAITDFEETADGVAYRGDLDAQATFLDAYGWGQGEASPEIPAHAAYRPVIRRTMFSGAPHRRAPDGFGKVGVVVSLATGAVQGAAFALGVLGGCGPSSDDDGEPGGSWGRGSGSGS